MARIARIICNSADGKLTEEEKLKLARLLVKAGYTVRIGRYKPTGKTVYVHYIEYIAAKEDGTNGTSLTTGEGNQLPDTDDQ